MFTSLDVFSMNPHIIISVRFEILCNLIICLFCEPALCDEEKTKYCDFVIKIENGNKKSESLMLVSIMKMKMTK